MSRVSDSEIDRIKQGLTDLGDAIFQLAKAEAPVPEITDRSISGNAIHGGIINKFHSVGIRDDSTRLVVVVDNNGILTDNIDVENIVGDTNVSGSLTVEGAITARSLHVDELTADVRQERTSPLEFVETDSDTVINKGLLWRGKDRTRQFVLKPNALYSSDPIDLHRDSFYSIDGIKVVDMNELGPTVSKSSLTQVGALQNLVVEGNMNIDQYVFWNGDYMRLGIGTETPNGTFGMVQDNAEFIIDTEGDQATFGTYTTTDLNIITDNAVRINVSATGKVTIGSDIESKTKVVGKLGVNINNPDADISTAGPVRFEGKLFEVADAIPTSGTYSKGDIVWNTDPKPTGYVGWICIKEGTPGVWKSFGQISS